MKAAARLLASVKPGKYLESGAPTGLTGLLTHPTPRSALLYHYHGTLDKLQSFPESSVYRQSTEALTKHRLKVVEEAIPEGWAQWQEKVQSQIAEDPEAFKYVSTSKGVNVKVPPNLDVDERLSVAEWDGESVYTLPEGIRSQRERNVQLKKLKGEAGYKPERKLTQVKVDPEPQYTEQAISDLESKLGAGLLEEVIQVAEGEHMLVEKMAEARIWESLEEPAPEGQWSYHERNVHTATQKP